MFGPTVDLTLTDDRVMIGGADLTGKLTRIALEVDFENRLAWMSFQAAVSLDELGLTFVPEQVKGYLGGGSGAIDLPREDIINMIEAAVIQGQGFGRGETAVGESVYAQLREWGVVEGGSEAEEPEAYTFEDPEAGGGYGS